MRIFCISALALLVTGAFAVPQTPKPISQALARARADNTRALLVFGDDGVRELLGKDLARLVLYEYELVELPADHVYGAPLRPEGSDGGFIVLLDAEAQVLARAVSKELSRASDLETLLRQHQAKPLDARQVLAQGLREAARSKRKAFVHFGAPW